MSGKPDINTIIDSAERIGTIGSPSSTKELSLDILGSAVEKKLVGELAFFKFLQDGLENFSIGQITDVELKNVWLEDPTMRSLARQRGQVNPVSGQQDTHLGIMFYQRSICKKRRSIPTKYFGNSPANRDLYPVGRR